MTNVNANVVINVNAKSAIAQIQALQNQVNSLNRTLALTGNEQGLRRVNQGFIDAANASGQFRAKIVPVTSSVDQFTQKLEKNKFTLGEYTRYAGSQIPGLGRMFRKEFDTMQRVAESRVRKIATAYTSLGESANGARKAIALTPTGALNMKDYSVQAELAAQKAAIFNKILRDGSTRMLNWGKNTQWAGRQLMVGFSIPLAMLGTAAAQTFKELDKASVSFRRVYGDLSTTTQEMERNLQAVKDLGQEYTKYGIAVADTIDLASRVAATGAENESLMAATKETLRLATLGQMEYNTALDATISMQTAFKISNEDLAGTIDYLNAVENQTILTMEDMAAAIPRVAPVVKGLGGDVKDLAAMMTALREGGVTAEQGANAIKSGLGRLINPTKAAKEQMMNFGISIENIIQQNKGDLMGMITSFGDALAKLGDFEQQQVLEKVFGKYQYARLGALFKNISNDAGQASRAMELAGMSATELAQLSEKELSKISESTSVKFEAAMERLKVSISPIGEQFMKAIMPVVEFFSKLFDKFNEMPDVIKNVVVIGTAALAGLGPVILMTVGLMANGLANITKGAILIRNAFNRLRGSHKSLEYIATAELEAATATGQLEGRMSGLTGVMLNQQAAIRRLIGLYAELATAAGAAASRMPAGMGGTRAPRVVRANTGLTMVPGTGNSDTVPALLTPGESVITKEATAKYAPILEQMNAGTLPGYSFGTVAVQSLRKVMAATQKNPMLSYAGSPRKAPSSFQTARRIFGESVPEDVIHAAYTIGGGTGRIDPKKAARYSRTAVAHIGKASKDGERKAWTARGTRLTTTAENEALQNIFSSKNRRDIAYNLFTRSDLKNSVHDRDIRNILFGGYHPTTPSEYKSAEKLLDLLFSDKTFMKSLKTKDMTEQMLMLRGFTKLRNNSHDYDLSSLGEDKYSIWSGEAKNFHQMIKQELGKMPEPVVQANNGLVPGVGNNDTIPALLTPGESVVTKEATAKYGPILQAMNDGNIAMRTEGGDAETGEDISPERYREQGSKPVRSHGTGGVEIDADTLAQIIEDERTKTTPNKALLRAASAQGYSNWIYGESQMANDNMLTGIERGATFSRDAGAMREQIMAPLIEAIAQEAPDLDLKNSPRVRSFIDSVADNMHEELTAIGDAIVDEAEFTEKDRKAFERALENSDLTEQERNAVMAARENIYTAKVRGPRGEHLGRVVLNPKSYRNIPVPSQGQDIAPFLTPEGLLARDAKRSGQSQTQTRATTAVRSSKVVQPRSGKEIRTTTVNPGTTVDRAYAMAASESISREEALSRVRALEEKESKKRILERARFFRSKGKSLEESLRLARQEEAQLKKEWKEENIRNKNEKERRRKDNATRKITQSAIRERRQSGELQRRYEAINPRAKWARRFGRTSDSVRERLGTARSGMGMLGRNMGRVSGGLSMGLGMASMMPMMMADEQGKFMGMDAGAATGGLMGASMLTGILPMLGPAAGPVAAVAVAAGAVAFGLNKWRNSIDSNAKANAELGAAVGGTANALNTMSSVLGVATPAQSQLMQQMTFTSEEEQNYGQFQQQLESETGQAFLKDLADRTSADRVTRLTDYISSAIASGLMDAKAGQTFAKTVAASLNDAVLGTAVASNIRGQVTGSKAFLERAQSRLDAVRTSSAIAEVAKAPDVGETGIQKSIATDVSAFAIGGAVQVIQDFSNAAAIARQEYANGTIAFSEYIDVVRNASMVQEEYSGIIAKSIAGAVDMQGARQALDMQLIASGMTQEQADALTHATDIGVNSSTLFGQGGYSAYISDYLSRKTDGTFKAGVSSEENDMLLAEAQRAQDAASKMFENGLNENLKSMVLAGKATAEQAAALGQELMNNSLSSAAEQYRKMAEEGKAVLGLEQAAFIQTAESVGVLGIAEGDVQRYIDVGIRFSEQNGSIAEYQAFINNLPEEVRVKMITSLENMSGQALAQTIQGSTDILGAFGQKYGAKVLQSRGVSAARKAVEGINYQGGYSGIPQTELSSADKQALRYQEDQNKTLMKYKELLGEEKAYSISIAADSSFNGEEIDPSEWTKELDNLGRSAIQIEENFPPEIISRLTIDFTSSEDINKWLESSKVFKDNWNTIKQLNPNIEMSARMQFLTLDSEGNPLSPSQVSANVIELNNAYDNLSSEDVEVKKDAIITLTATMQGEDGELIGEGFATNIMDKWLKDKDLGGKVYKADPSIVMAAIEMEYDAKALLDQAKELRESAKELSGIDGLEATASLANEQAAALEKAGKKMQRSAKESIITSAGTGGEGGPTGGGGGGGGSESPLKGFKEGILDQIKLWVDADAKLKDLNAAKSKFVKDLIEGNGIFGQLANVKGIDMANLQNIMGMGPKGAKDFIKKYIKDGKLIKEGQRLLNAANIAGAGQTIGEAVIAQRTAGTQTRAANILGRRGASRELIDTIAGDPAKAAQLVALQKNINNNVEGSRKAMNKFINEQQKAIDKAKELAKELDPAQWASDEWQKYAEQTNAYFDKQFADIETNANLIFKATYGRSVGETEALIRANEDLIDAERDRIQVIEDSIRVLETRKGKEKDYSDWGTEQIQKEIDSNNRLISGLERRNELDQRRVEEIQRASEIRSRDAEAINHDLDLMSQAEDDINEAYDKKIEALDEIVKINDHLIQQQQQQLNLSRAISEGDIYAATAAAQEMRASSAGFAAEQVRAGIEQGRQNQIDNLLTAGGLTREEAEKEIRNIDEQNYQASLLARKIEDDIYTRTLNEIIPLKDKEYNLNLALQSVQDQIAVKQLEIRDIERGKVEELQRANDLMREQINDHLDNIQTQQEGVKNLAGQTREEFDNIAKSIEASNAWTIAQGLDTAEGARQAKNLADQWEVVGNAIQRARKAMLTDVGKLEKVELTKEYTAEDRAKDIADRRAAYEAEVAGIFADPAAISDTSLGGTPTLVGSGADLVGNGMGGAFAGGLMKYAVGGKVMGSGARDSIPTMLSPGEFVVRKAMVDKYGMPMFNAINQGSFSLPRYDTGEIEMPETIVSNSGNTTNVSAPVYNTYDMKFSINGTNANADDIANRVMMKMAQVQGQNIRSSRGY